MYNVNILVLIIRIRFIKATVLCTPYNNINFQNNVKQTFQKVVKVVHYFVARRNNVLMDFCNILCTLVENYLYQRVPK